MSRLLPRFPIPLKTRPVFSTAPPVLRTVIIEALDWRECLERYDRPRTVMYLDPPYPGNGANYRHNMRAAASRAAIPDCRVRAGYTRRVRQQGR